SILQQQPKKRTFGVMWDTASSFCRIPCVFAFAFPLCLGDQPFVAPAKRRQIIGTADRPQLTLVGKIDSEVGMYNLDTITQVKHIYTSEVGTLFVGFFAFFF
ncbi:hypothetical protein ACJX0J_008908, partial [Zea mays]